MEGKDDFSALGNMIYSGRGIIVGRTPKGDSFVGYSLTGRSPSSQARRLIHDEESGVVRTDVTDKEQLEQGSPALLIYPAIVCKGNRLIASNGAQTEVIFSKTKMGPETSKDILDSAFQNYVPHFRYDKKDQKWIDITTYEPDAPNNTPRISALLTPFGAAMHIVKFECGERKSDTFPIELSKGQASLITTYSGENENPLLPFKGNPLEVSVGSNTPDEIVDSIYSAIHGGANLGDNYAVSAAVMMLKGGKPQVAIRNRFEASSD